MAKLFLNHMDAWGVTLVIGALALVLHGRLTPRYALLVVVLGLGYWLAFALNDYFDATADALSPRKARRNYFVGRDKNGRFLWLVTAVALIPTVILASYGWPGIVALVVGLFIMWAYSAPPLRLKNRPGLDLLTHALFVQTFPYTVTLLLARAMWSLVDGFVLTILTLASLAAQLEQQLRDFAVDAVTGGTFATRAGLQTTNLALRLATGSLIVVALVGIVVGAFPGWLLPFGAIGLPALAHRFWRGPQAPRSEKLVMVSVMVGAMYMAGVIVVALVG